MCTTQRKPAQMQWIQAVTKVTKAKHARGVVDLRAPQNLVEATNASLLGSLKIMITGTAKGKIEMVWKRALATWRRWRKKQRLPNPFLTTAAEHIHFAGRPSLT